PGTPPTTPLVAPAGGGGASCVLCTGARMPVFVGVNVDEDGGVGARSFMPLPAAAGGGCKYNIVSVCRLGSGSVRNSGMITTASKRRHCNARAPVPAKGFRPSFAPDSISQNKESSSTLWRLGGIG